MSPNLPRLIAVLERGLEVFRASFVGLPEEEARWKPPDGGWSLLEILCHLRDEEREDFRTRLELTLSEPETDWPGIDPEGWPDARRYAKRDLDEMWQSFAAERRRSIEWLSGLVEPRWENRRTHPRAGVIRAGDLLLAWCAHDQLHLRQIARRRLEFVAAQGPEFSWEYAGRW